MNSYNSGIQLPANNSIRLSSYIAALDRYMGLSGFAFPVTDTREGVKYEFDLFHPGESNLFKVFTQFDEEQFERYERFREDESVSFIFDATNMSEPCPGCGGPCLEFVDEDLLSVAADFQALVYLAGRFWRMIGDEGEERWEVMTSIEQDVVNRLLFHLNKLAK